jgi:hypothetical protein
VHPAGTLSAAAGRLRGVTLPDAGGTAVDRYAARNANFVLVVGPHGGPGARSAPKDNANQPRAQD